MILTLTTITHEEGLDLLLRGAQAKRAEIDAHLRDLRSQLNHDGNVNRKNIALAQVEMTRQYMQGGWHSAPEPRKRRRMSAATRKRMAEAQRARWAKVKAA